MSELIAAEASTEDEQQCQRIGRDLLPLASTFYYIRIAGDNGIGFNHDCLPIFKDFLMSVPVQ